MSMHRLEPHVNDLPLRSAPSFDHLAGVKVLDLTTSIAGPYAGQLLADMGATVVKVEKPKGGDDGVDTDHILTTWLDYGATQIEKLRAQRTI